MAGGVHHIGSPTISSTASGPAPSSAIKLDSKFSDVTERVLGVGAPASLDSTVNLQVDRTSTGDWVDLAQDGSTSAVTIPAGGFRAVSDVAAPRMRLTSSTGESADRTFEVWLR